MSSSYGIIYPGQTRTAYSRTKTYRVTNYTTGHCISIKYHNIKYCSIHITLMQVKLSSISKKNIFVIMILYRIFIKLYCIYVYWAKMMTISTNIQPILFYLLRPMNMRIQIKIICVHHFRLMTYPPLIDPSIVIIDMFN